MISFQIDSALQHAAPNLKLGVLTARVQNSEQNDELQARIDKQLAALQAQFEIANVNSLAPIAAQRSAYKALGKDPSRYRGSAEALLRRVLQGKGLYNVNTLVDLNNLISLNTLHPVGSYDLSKLQQPFVFRVGQAGESYKGIGKAEISIENLPLIADEQGPFGSPTSDSERAMITQDTKQVMMVIYAFSGGDLTPVLAEAEALLQSLLHATEITRTIL